jgi:toxin ParE1/3/4
LVIWTLPAKADLRQIHDFIAHGSKFYAKRVTGDIFDKINVLNKAPLIGKITSELNNEEIIEIPMYSYRIIYEVKKMDAFILTIVHKRRDLQSEDIEDRF